ncbi:hypothetical protein [Variovorax sp. efr-133-TYG-130]|nr:hypothetical protein [Variovorax sp. efr-133-TYG-130]
MRLHQTGKLQRLARGLYGLPDAEVLDRRTTNSRTVQFYMASRLESTVP